MGRAERNPPAAPEQLRQHSLHSSHPMCMELGSAPTCGVMPLGTVGWPGTALGCLHMMHCGTVTPQQHPQLLRSPQAAAIALSPLLLQPPPITWGQGEGGRERCCLGRISNINISWALQHPPACR